MPRTPRRPDSIAVAAAARPLVVPIVALGASAGGLDAFTQFLIALPPDTGMAFILIQHLQPDHKSLLAQLLQRSTAMPVQEVSDGCFPLANHVYVAPANRSVSLQAGRLRLMPNPGDRGLHLPINAFFQSLAEERKGAAIAVVLSGNASDGTAGLAAIKAHGGICIAQSPPTAAFDGMARSAIASGAVDYILAPDEIAREVARMARHPYLVASAHGTTALQFNPTQDPRYRELITLLHNNTGVDFAQYRTSTIGRRIARRMALRQIRNLPDYLRYVQENPGEVQLLFDELLISATRFFRDPDVFACLAESVLPEMLAKRDAGVNAAAFRMWSVGCASGEEAYTLAMIGLEAFERLRAVPNLQVFGTDLSEPAIRRARQGRYGHQIVSDVSSARLERFFDRSETGFRVNKTLRDACVFAQHHIAGEVPFSRLDLVCCRNLLIYMEPAMQHHVLPMLHFALNPRGVLVLGSAESAHEFSTLFEPVASADQRLKIYTKIDGSPRHARFVVAQRQEVTAPAPVPAAILPQLTRIQARPSIEEADRIVLDLYAPRSTSSNSAATPLLISNRLPETPVLICSKWRMAYSPALSAPPWIRSRSAESPSACPTSNSLFPVDASRCALPCAYFRSPPTPAAGLSIWSSSSPRRPSAPPKSALPIPSVRACAERSTPASVFFGP